MAKSNIVKLERGLLKVGKKTIAKVASIAEAKGFLKAKYGSRFKETHAAAKKNPRLYSKAASRHGKKYRYVVQGGPSQPTRVTDSLKAAKKIMAAMVKKAPHEWVEIYDEHTGNFVAKHRTALNPKKRASAKRKPSKRKAARKKTSSSKRKTSRSKKTLSKAAFLKRMALGRANAKRNPSTRYEFDVAQKHPSHGWVIVDFGYGDKESAVDAARNYRAEEKYPTQVIKRLASEDQERSKAFMALKAKKNPPYRRYGSGEHRVIHRTTGPRHFGSLHYFEKEEDAKKFAKDAKGIYAGKRKAAKKNPKSKKRGVPAAFRAAAQRAKAMTPAQRSAWAKKMQAARKAAAKHKSNPSPNLVSGRNKQGLTYHEWLELKGFPVSKYPFFAATSKYKGNERKKLIAQWKKAK